MSFFGFGPSTGHKILICPILLFKIGQEFKSVGTAQMYPQFMGVYPSGPPSPICSIIQMFLNDNLLSVISFFMFFFFIRRKLMRCQSPLGFHNGVHSWVIKNAVFTYRSMPMNCLLIGGVHSLEVVILLQIAMVSPGTHLVKTHESQSITNESQFKKNKEL